MSIDPTTCVPRINYWYTQCCARDLARIDDTATIWTIGEERAYSTVYVYPTLDAALTDISHWSESDREDILALYPEWAANSQQRLG